MNAIIKEDCVVGFVGKATDLRWLIAKMETLQLGDEVVKLINHER